MQGMEDGMSVEPLTKAEQFALNWVNLCKLFGYNPEDTSPLDFKPVGTTDGR